MLGSVTLGLIVVMIIAVGHPSEDATVPAVAKIKKPLPDILTVYDQSIERRAQPT